jgi:hypothetical protein
MAPGRLRRCARALGVSVLYACVLSACAHSPAAAPVTAPASAPAAAAVGAAAARPSAAVRAFEGAWAYAQSCGWQHSANLEFSAAGQGRLQGRWADGTRVRGESGSLRANVRGDKAFLSFCRDPDEAGSADADGICPNYGPESAYVVRNGERLEWFRGSAKLGFRPYLRLHRVVAGQEIPKDDTCPEEGDDG